MADIALSNLDYSTRSSYGSHDLDHDVPTPSTWIDFDRESTFTLLPLTNGSPTDDNRGASSRVDYPGNVSSDTLASDTFHLRHRREPPWALANQGEPYQNLSSVSAEFVTGGKGWWKQQMLVDRSLRTMAALTATFALIMVITCLAYLGDFVHRKNPYSTSVGRSNQSCKNVERTDAAIHLLINIAATMTLGMSNTYQQLITSLKVDEIRWMLSKHEDSQVGTNSPMTIKHKKNGKVGSSLAWLLLIATSLPLHLLANSIIGPSYYLKPPEDLHYHLQVSDSVYYSDNTIYSGDCWEAFLSGEYFLSTFGVLKKDLSEIVSNGQFQEITIVYGQNCSQYQNSTTIQNPGHKYWEIGNCTYEDVSCSGSRRENLECRLNIRMSATITLTGCLLIKAIYMIVVNITARHRTKTHCLTFGDVLVASAIESDLQVHNECLVNAGDGHRHHIKHTCHQKHCSTDSGPSLTGDDIGHCQKCKRFNITDKAADLPHPCVSTKFKKSLISNLGSTAVSQMMILMVCSLVMLSISIMLAVRMASAAGKIKYDCRVENISNCSARLSTQLRSSFGTFGGFQGSAYLSSLPPDSLSSELLTFAISNGAQLLYSLLYLLLIYNITLISMERDWGKFERQRHRPRCTLVKGDVFKQSYLLQLPKKVLYPMMTFSAIMHWLLGQAISTTELVWLDRKYRFHSKFPADSGEVQEHSMYTIGYGTYSIWLSTILMVTMTATCWWAFTYKREGFMPQMYGSIRACCAATTELRSFPREGIQWGDLGEGEKFRHAGFSSSPVGKIKAGELYCGRGSLRLPESHVE
ncbi:hypothetical protein MMC22_007761 [Lobaria immixta]|nr:hypothetical protein [Lobaria immixta]